MQMDCPVYLTILVPSQIFAGCVVALTTLPLFDCTAWANWGWGQDPVMCTAWVAADETMGIPTVVTV